MQNIKKYFMTLALLLTAVTGAWAQDGVKLTTTEIVPPAAWNNDNSYLLLSDMPGLKADAITEEQAKAWADVPKTGLVGLIYGYVDAGDWIDYKIINFTDGQVLFSNSISLRHSDVYNEDRKYYYATGIEGGIEVTWDAATKTGTFAMPGSDVVLTPIYAAATVYGADGQTEKKAYETLKEAIQKVQNGDVIKLDWNVTLTETLETPTIDGGVKFTLDFNGYTLDCGTTYKIQLKNAGDQLTFTDSSDDQLGGLIAQNFNVESGREFVFDAGRYNISGATAKLINGFCANASITMSLAEGKEFFDLEGGAEANDGFNVRVDYATYELAIDSKRFATFYADNKVKLVEETPAGVDFYTITGIDTDRSMASVTKLTGIVEAGTPMLVYNNTGSELTVKIQATSDAANTANTGDIAPEFRGTATDREFTADDMAAADYYALSGGKAFAPVYKPGTIGANKCWLQFDKQQIPSARQFTLVFEETTGIGLTPDPSPEGDGSVYDLQGRRVAKPAKGVFIQNGKKVVK